MPYRVHEPASLLARHSSLVQSVQGMVGIPADHWHKLYFPLFEDYARFVQLLPASEAHHHSGPGGLLRHGLEVDHEALKLRRTTLLPPGAAAETVAHQQDIWTYACTSAALLHDLGKPITDTLVIIGNKRWHLLSGPMPVGARYRIEFNTQRRHHQHERIPPLLVRYLLPETGLAWLSEENEILAAWLATIQGDLDQAGPLGAIIAKADGISVAQDLAGSQRIQLPTARTRPLSDRLLTGLRFLLTDGSLPINRPGAAGFLHGEDLWLVSKRILDSLREHLIQEGQTGVPSRNDRLMDELQQHGLIIANGDRAIWHCQVSIGEWSQQLTCLRFPAGRIWPDSSQIPKPLDGSVSVIDKPESAVETSPEAQSTTPAMPPSPDTTTDKDDTAHVRSEHPVTAQLPQDSTQETGDELPLPFDPPPEKETLEPEHQSLSETGVEEVPGDSGQRFIAWLISGITEHQLEINTPKARLHVLSEGLALVSPGIFRDFDPQNWQKVQKRFQKRRLHRKTPEDTNIWTCQVAKERKRSTIKVILIPDPEQRLGITLPKINPTVSIIT